MPIDEALIEVLLPLDVFYLFINSFFFFFFLVNMQSFAQVHTTTCYCELESLCSLFGALHLKKKKKLTLEKPCSCILF